MQFSRPQRGEVKHLTGAQHLKKAFSAVTNCVCCHTACPRFTCLDEVDNRIVRLVGVAHLQVLDPRPDLDVGLGSHVSRLQRKAEFREAGL